jgi:hypothetical protein
MCTRFARALTLRSLFGCSAVQRSNSLNDSESESARQIESRSCARRRLDGAITDEDRIGLDRHPGMALRQQRRVLAVRSRPLPIENASGGQKEAANTHRAHPSTQGRSVADPSDQGAVTRHIGHRKGARTDQRVDRIATQRPHGFGVTRLSRDAPKLDVTRNASRGPAKSSKETHS